MKVEPKIMNNVCLSSHPKGCAIEVEKQIDYIKKAGKVKGPKNVLILGVSAGYGLATRIACAYGCDSVTLGLSFEKKPTETKLGSMGWYNNAAFEKSARRDGLKAATLNGDAFSPEAKEAVIAEAKKLFGSEKIDLVVYSLASPTRVVDGETYRSVLKPMGAAPYSGKTVDIFTGSIRTVEVEPATAKEAADTIKVMGGEDWALWMDALLDADLLAAKAVTVAYSYIGPSITYAIYRDGTIGGAKTHLETTANALTQKLASIGGAAYVSVNKAVVTRASSVIPVVPLYLALLFKIMKKMGLHEGCIEQEYRMLKKIYGGAKPELDKEGRVRLDDLEMREDIQASIAEQWAGITEVNLKETGDLEGVRKEFMNLHGFEVAGVDYSADVNPLSID